MCYIDHMDASDNERSREAPIPITFLYTHGSGISQAVGTQAVAFQPLVGAAGNGAVCAEAVAPTQVAGNEAVAPTQVAGNQASSFHPSSPFQMWLRNVRCGFGASNTHAPCR